MTLADFGELIKEGFEVYRKTQAQDSYGDAVDTWPDAPHLTLDGVLRQLSGGKRFISEVHGYNASHRFYATPPADIALGDQIRFDGEVYQVNAVNDVMGLSELLQIDMEWLGHEQVPAGS